MTLLAATYNGGELRDAVNLLESLSLWTLAAGYRDFGANRGTLDNPVDAHAGPVLVKSAAGLLTSVAANVLSRSDRGLQTVPSRTELMTPDLLDITGVMTIVSGTGTATRDAPDPTGVAASAWTLADTSAAAAYSRQRNFTVANDSLTHVASVDIAKVSAAPAVYPMMHVGYAGGTGKDCRAAFDPLTGRLTLENANARWTVEDHGTFWRVAAAITNNSTGNTTLFFAVTPARNPALAYAVDVAAVGSHVFSWPNVQKANYPVAPYLDDGAFAGNLQVRDISEFAGAAMSGVIVGTLLGSNDGDVLWSRNDGTANNWIGLIRVGNKVNFRVITGGVTQADLEIGPLPQMEFAVAYAVGTNYARAQFARGLAVAADTSVTLPTVTAESYFGDGYSVTRNSFGVTRRLTEAWGVADAGAFATALNKARFALALQPAAWDNFDKPDGAIGLSKGGQAWAQVAASGVVVTATVSGKTLVAADSGYANTASYSALDVGQNVSKVRAKVSWGAGTDGGIAALIITSRLNTNNVQHITAADGGAGSIHISFTNSRANISFFENGNLSDLLIPVYPGAMAQDGTVYDIGYDLSGSTATFYLPGMAPLVLTDPRFASLTGRYVTFEHYWSTGQCRPVFHLAMAA